MLIEFARPVEMMDAGRALRFEAGERRNDLPDPIARSFVDGGYAALIETAAAMPAPERAAKRRKR